MVWKQDTMASRLRSAARVWAVSGCCKKRECEQELGMSPFYKKGSAVVKYGWMSARLAASR